MNTYKTDLLDLRCMNCMDGLKLLDDGSVNTCVTGVKSEKTMTTTFTALLLLRLSLADFTR